MLNLNGLLYFVNILSLWSTEAPILMNHKVLINKIVKPMFIKNNIKNQMFHNTSPADGNMKRGKGVYFVFCFGG